MSEEISLKVLLSAMLPYGYLSPEAVILTMGLDACSCTEYALSISMDDRKKRCDYYRQYLQTYVRGFERVDLLTKQIRKLGDRPYENITAAKLTQSALEFLLGLNGSFQDIFLVQTRTSSTPRSYTIATIPTTPGSMPGLAPTVATYLRTQNKELKINDLNSYTSHLNAAQYNRYWKLGNIQTMFLVNGFMTPLDRRPIVNGWAICGNKQDITNPDEESPTDINIYTLTNAALKQWYEQNPDRISCFETAIENMPPKDNNTPAFYTAKEILSLIGEGDKEDSKANHEDSFLRYTFSGLAVGPKCRYIVHHTQPYKMSFYKQVELNTITAVKLALLSTNSISPNDDGLTKYALIFVHNRFQFKNLFNSFFKKSKGNKNPQIIVSPYTSIHLIPIIGSGVMQLRCLMLSTPYEYEKSIITKLKKLDYRFQDNDDPTYKLTFNSVPVLVAHAMDVGQLYVAWLDHKSGKDFYVSCYPEQRSFINCLMPGTKFL